MARDSWLMPHGQERARPRARILSRPWQRGISHEPLRFYFFIDSGSTDANHMIETIRIELCTWSDYESTHRTKWYAQSNA